ILITIDSSPTPLFISRQAGAEKLLEALKRGDRILAKGMQRDYQGQKEIEVTRPSDVKIFN
ncbi:MAG: hypothetical protein LUQ53_03805, partial [Methanothrix sp.]|nr:hypothetical protein [Methanothrix sp.]